MSTTSGSSSSNRESSTSEKRSRGGSSALQDHQRFSISSTTFNNREQLLAEQDRPFGGLVSFSKPPTPDFQPQTETTTASSSDLDDLPAVPSPSIPIAFKKIPSMSHVPGDYNGGSTSPVGGYRGSRALPTAVRYRYQEVDGAHYILQGREGEVTRCEDELIHCPGSVQAYGVLIVFDEDDAGNLNVVQVSENSPKILGISPATFFSKPLTTFLTHESEESLRSALDSLGESDAASTPYTFSLNGTSTPTLTTPNGRPWFVYAALHRPNPFHHPSRAILELELDEAWSPRTVLDNIPGSTARPLPFVMNISSFDYGGLPEMSRMRRARERAKGKKPDLEGSRRGGDALRIVELMSEIETEFRKATNVKEFSEIVTSVVKEFTEFDRVMLYKFDEEWNGQVIAEVVDASRTSDTFLGLHFPATDIPAQARDLYIKNKVRVLFNGSTPTARLVCNSLTEVENAADMSQGFLRAMSPIHILCESRASAFCDRNCSPDLFREQDLRNMGVTSTLTISVVVSGVLWGLIACHHYEPKGHRISFPMRQLCRLLSDSAGRNLETLLLRKRVNARKVLNTRPTAEYPNGFITATPKGLLELFDSDFGCLSIGEEHKNLGTPNTYETEVLNCMLRYLRKMRFSEVKSTVDVQTDFPDLDYPRRPLAGIAGFLVIPLAREGRDFMFVCRKSRLESVQWGGNPHRLPTASILEPRASFEAWSETVVGKCKPWTETLEEAPDALMLVYGKFISVWREKQQALITNRLASQIILDAKEEDRTPIHSVIAYLEDVLDETLDYEVNAKITSNYPASRTLLLAINDLLDITRIDRGEITVAPAPSPELFARSSPRPPSLRPKDDDIESLLSTLSTEPSVTTPATTATDYSDTTVHSETGFDWSVGEKE